MKKTVFKAFLIPNEYLKGIKGGIGIEGESAVKCPSCKKTLLSSEQRILLHSILVQGVVVCGVLY